MKIVKNNYRWAVGETRLVALPLHGIH